MLTEFQTKKIKKLFEWCDASNNGYLEEGDYIAVGERMAQERNWSTDSLEYAKLRERLLADWGVTSQFADANNDNRVSWEEWQAFCDFFMANEQAYEITVTNIAEAFFTVADADGDGQISHDDWRLVFRVYGQPETVADESFASLDTNADGRLVLDEIQQALKTFFTSEDRAEPANAFFGKL